MIKNPHIRKIRFGSRKVAKHERARTWRNGRYVLVDYFFMHEHHCQWMMFL